MKLRNLAIVVALLIAASVAVRLATRPDARPADRDPRVGQTLADAGTLAQAARVTITDNGQTVALARATAGKEGDAGWTVTSYHDQPADFTKLATLTRALLDAKVDRFVTATPEKIERLGLDQTRIEFSDTDGQALWTVELGRTADTGGRFVRFGDDVPAYLTRVNAWIDPVAKNWADSALVSLRPADIARVEIGLPDGTTITAARERADDAFTSPDAKDGETLKTGVVTSLLNSLTGLRFTDTSAPEADDATAARAHARTVKLTTFDGATLTIALGRRPAETKTPEATTASDDAESPATATTKPAGPVYAFVSSSEPDAAINRRMEQRAFEVAEFVFTSLPANREGLFETKPVEPAASASPEATTQTTGDSTPE